MILFIVLSLFLVFIAYWYLIPHKKRNLFLLICSLGFIAIFNLAYSLYYLVFISLVYITILAIKERPDLKRPIFITLLIFLISIFCFLKYFRLFFDLSYLLLSSFTHLTPIKLPVIIFPLGFSFIIFRLLHYIIEVNRNKIQDTSFVDFALYLTFFPTFLAGPLERFPDFYRQAKEIALPDTNMFCYGLWRILLGIVKKCLIADMLFAWTIAVLASPGSYSRLIVIGAVYGAMIRLYMDFSGYTDIAIGVSRLFGYKIVENFNRPLLQKNIALFWRNWHISLYTWIRDYFYLPLFAYRASILKLYLGSFLTMALFMLWHGSSINFLVSGIINGLGLVIWLGFQDLQKKIPSLRNFLKSSYLTPLSIFLTFTYVSFVTGIFFSAKDSNQLKALLTKIFL